MSAFAAVLTGTSVRAALSVTFILIVAFFITGTLSSAYKRAREQQGHHHYEIGVALQGAGNVEGAAEEYRKALLFLPDEPDYRLSLAVTLIELNRLEEAETHLQALIEDQPTNGLISLMLARVAERRHEPDVAIAYFQRAVYGYWPRNKLSKRHAARWELVKLLEQQGRTNEAIGELLQLYANAPDDHNEKSEIGFMLLRYGATSDAEKIFRDLVRDAPNYAEAHHGLGEALLDGGDALAARREFQRAIHLDPKDKENLDLLTVANSIISLDPTLPRLNAKERVRRGRMLLERVLNDLEPCVKAKAPDAPLEQTLASAHDLLDADYTDSDDYTTQLEDKAGQLWSSRKAYCTAQAPTDRAVETVLARIGQ